MPTPNNPKISMNDLDDLIDECVSEQGLDKSGLIAKTVENALVSFTQKLAAYDMIDFNYRWSMNEIEQTLSKLNSNPKLSFEANEANHELHIRLNQVLIGDLYYGNIEYFIRWWADATYDEKNDKPRVFTFVSTDDGDDNRFNLVMDEINEVVKIIENTK